MKRFVVDFLRRGLPAAGLGPIVLAIVYLILRQTAGIDTLSVEQVCTGIFSLTALGFVAGGINALYRIERLPLLVAILLHGIVLYGGYLFTYLLNGWLALGTLPIILFTAIFVVGYLVIWVIIHAVIKRSTARLNQLLAQKQSAKEE